MVPQELRVDDWKGIVQRRLYDYLERNYTRFLESIYYSDSSLEQKIEQIARWKPELYSLLMIELYRNHPDYGNKL